MFNFIKNIGPSELVIIGIILIVFFGSKRIANLGKSAGEATKEVKKIKKQFTSAVEDAKSEPTAVEEKKD